MKKNSFGLFLMFLLSVVSVEYCSAAADSSVVVQEDQRCSICLNSLSNLVDNHQLPITLGCSHSFHRDCIIEWLKLNPRCPNCRDVVDLSASKFTPQEIADIEQDRYVNAQQAIAAQVMADAGVAQQLAGNVPPVQNQNQLLIIVASMGNLQAVENALNQGANVNAVDMLRRTALMAAAREGYAAIVERLLNVQGINVNAVDRFGGTALMWATGGGHAAIVERLLNVQGVDVNAVDRYGRTALISAAENGHAVIVEMLTNAGA